MDYEQVRKLAQAATPGPWRAVFPYRGQPQHTWVEGTDGCSITTEVSRVDAAFIAAAREAVPALLDERDRLAAEVAALREAVAQLENWVPEGVPLREISLLVNGPDMYEPGDDLAPFLSEAFLYNLMGKEHARTLLAYLRLNDPSPTVAEVLRLVALGRKVEAQDA